MSITSDLAFAEKRLAALINSRADSEEREARADQVARVRADDAKCATLMAEYQEDYRAFGAEPPLVRSDEWASQYQKRLLRGLQRRLSPDSKLADLGLLDGVPAPALANFSQMIRDEASREAFRPSEANLPESVDDPRARIERTDSATGERRIEYRAKRSFIHDLSQQPLTVMRIVDPRTQNVLFGPAFDKAPRSR
jgi:hypothetical protein